MTSINTSPALDHAIVGAINPASTAAGTSASGWIKADKFAKYLAILQSGVLGSSATLDCKLQQATDGSGTGVKDVAGKSITQLVKATDDNKQVELGLTPSELDYANGFHWFRVLATVGTATSLISGVVLGLDPKYGPASENDATTVAQVVL